MVINEAEVQQNPPPDGMRTCGNFTWGVTDFNEKLMFDPDNPPTGATTSGNARNELAFNLVIAVALLTSAIPLL